jgi:hypothetical protein
MKHQCHNSFTTLLLWFVITLALVVALSGCSTTVPVTAKFPETPNRLMQKCPQLETVSDETKLSELTKTVTMNYSTYYSCAVTVDGWIEWYIIQKAIFEKAVK